jgi:hypothetical protein
MKRAGVLLAVALVGCGGERLASPAMTDEALEEGRVLSLPITGEWPRLGIQWTYDVLASGFPPAEKFPPRIAYRLTATDDMGHPWSGPWMYGTGRGMDTTGATIRDDYVFFHPPRLDEFGQLEYAPWPTGSPGHEGRSESTLTLGQGYGEAEGKTLTGVERDLGWGAVSAPAGTFERAWRVEGETPSFAKGPAWKGRFWWVPRVGWVAMEWDGSDGRHLEMRLAAVHDVRAAK